MADRAHTVPAAPVAAAPDAGDVGLALLLMRSASDMQKWLTRRVDEIEFLDHATAQRRVRLDVNLNGLGPGGVPARDGYHLLPLARLSRTAHTTLTVHDEAGAALPRLNMEEERALACAGAQRVAARVLEREPDSGTVAEIAAVLNDRRPADGFDDKVEGSDRQTLAAHPNFLDLLNELRRHFHLIALVPESAPARRVLTYAYLEQPARLFSVPAGKNRRRWIAGNAIKNAVFPPAGVFARFVVETPGEAASYHIELTAPYDIELHEGALAGPWADDGERRLYKDDDLSRTTAHGFCRPRPGLDGGTFEVRLAPTTEGMVRSSAVTTALIFLVLLATWVYVRTTTAAQLQTSPDRSSATSVLLLAPAVLAATLAAPSRHSMTTALLRGTRLTVAVACLAAFASAGAIAFRLAKPNLLLVLLVCWGVGALMAARLAVQLTRLVIQRRRTASDIASRRPAKATPG